MRLACAHLLALGHRRIGLISAPLELNFARQRSDSFAACLRGADLEPERAHLIDNSLDRRAKLPGHAAIAGQFAAPDRRDCRQPPVRSRRRAGAARCLSIDIGSEMSVIVWGGIEDSLLGENLTTINLPNIDQAGAKLVAMLTAVVAWGRSG
ncbi:hypothetical protein LP420_18835 [Massilia sp. B-10]|nr:hypothetical protein LP420_18835 [Massilia sp. B-10]